MQCIIVKEFKLNDNHHHTKENKGNVMPTTDMKAYGDAKKLPSFRTRKGQDSIRRLIGSIFEESSDQLDCVSKKLDKLQAFVGSCLEQEKADEMSEDEYDMERRRWASALDNFNQEISSAISELFQLQVWMQDKTPDLRRRRRAPN